MNTAYRFYFIVFISLISGFGLAQPATEFQTLSTTYPGERALMLMDRDHVEISLIGDSLRIYYDRYSETIYLDNMAGLFTEHSVDYSEFDHIVSIEAATLAPVKNKYKELKVRDFTHKEKLSRSVFYDGGKSVSFLYPKLEPGTKSYIKYRKRITEPRFLPSFYFQRGIPVLKAEFSLTVSDGVEIGWKPIHVDESEVHFTSRKNKNNTTTYKWEARNIEKLTRETDAPDARYHTPHIITWIKSYKTADGEVNLLGDTRALYQWYYSLVKDANKDESEELKKIVDSLKTGSTDELETVREIFYWVQDNIKYIAIEDGMGGFVPRSAKSVCEKRYGDCKDMSSILQKMLQYADISAYLAWIGSRDIPYSYSEVATPSVDNHMICAYIRDGRYYFLDATGQYTPLGSPTAFIQGKEALIGIDGDSFIVHRVPVLHSDQSRVTDSVNVRIDGNKLAGQGKSSLTGYAKINLTYTLSNRSDDWIKVARDLYGKGNNKFLIDSLEIKNLYDRDKELQINYSFNIDNYVKQASGEFYINLHLDKLHQTSTIKKDRKYPMDFDNSQSDVSVVRMEVPAGYSIKYLPAGTRYGNENFGFSVSYRELKNGIEMTRVFYNNLLLLTQDNFDNWNNMIKELNKAYSEVVVLNKL